MTSARREDGRFDLVVVANRLPVDLDEDPDHSSVWKRSPGGLVTALEPVLRSESGAWVGWPGVADRDLEPFSHDGLHVHPVQLSAEELAGYYEGFSNGTLWPLYHDVVKPPTFERRWWATYKQVNARFAQAAADVAAPSATVWVQDYQLQLVPQMLRELRPDVTIGFFLHIPFPPREIFMQLPWRRSIIEGLLGADLVGFQMPGGAENFRELAGDLHGLTTRPPADGLAEVLVGGRVVRVGAFPISADSADLATVARSEAIRQRAQQIRHDLGDPEKILLGVDRLDYTKGIGLRLDAVGELFDEGQLEPGRHVMVQIATPSREQVQEYAQMRTAIETKVGHINGDHGELGTTAVHYLYQGVDRDELIALFVAADLMTVTPLRDGMNLVAKEYVACHPEGGGALVLSEFAGAAAELVQAYLVNPHDVDMVKDTIMAALEAVPAERDLRMRELHEQVMSHDVHDWAHSFLGALATATGSQDGGSPDPHREPTSSQIGGMDLLAERVSDLARAGARSVGTAESLTAGRISSLLGAARESSTWYRGGIVAYASEVKHSLLHVSSGPVVSEEAAREMAERAAGLLGADTVVAVTGAGGPDPQDGQPPGTVWFAIFDRGVVTAEERVFDTSPAEVVESTVRHALELLVSACAAD